MRGRVKVIVGALALALAAAVGVAGASVRSDPGVSSNSILIGGTFPLSGPASLYGTIPQAEKAYFDWFNARARIHGRKVNFKFLDDGYDPSQTVPLTRQLVERDHVFAMFNSLGTAPQLAVRGYLNSRKVPQVLVATGDSYWGSQYRAYPWTIGYQPDYPGEGKIYGLYIRTHVRGAKIGVLMQNDAYGRNYLAGLRAGLGKKKNLIVSVQPFDVEGSGRHPADARAEGLGRERLHGLRDADAVDQVARHRDEDRLEADAQDRQQRLGVGDVHAHRGRGRRRPRRARSRRRT